MSTELTPREHDDMRDLLVASTQRIRPAMSRRVRISTGVAIALVAATIGGVATSALNTVREGSPVFGDPTPTLSRAPSPSPAPTPGDEVPATRVPGPGEVLEVIGGNTVTRLPAVLPPAPGTYVTLQQDPVLTAGNFILGSGLWLEEQGIDVASARGYQSVGSIHPWTANLKDGSGECILIRKNYITGGWSEIVCNADGVPAWVERELDGALLRFTIADDGVDVYRVPR